MGNVCVELTDAHRNLIYHIDVLGVSVKRAGELCGISAPYEVLKRPEVAAAREALQQASRRRVNITKDDVLLGIQDAIQDAKLVEDPMAQIAGWREISKMLGYDAPRKVTVVLEGPVAQQRKMLEQLSDSEIAQLVDDNIIDGEFYVRPDAG